MLRITVDRRFTPTPFVVSQGKFAEAEPLYERSQALNEKIHGPEHEAVATSLNNRAALLHKQVRATRKFSENSCVVGHLSCSTTGRGC